jgi:hypothetical protein
VDSAELMNAFPPIRRALDIAEKYFVDLVLDKQRLLASEKHIHAMLALVPDQEVYM